ncbi:tRNA (adenosine(37)-N6)-dimethylallyltransferase MiaA [Vagococcus intermedius]|uniref:tRNA dimethylallyltransferase n=1 Tax=Vagococcus intermedius TaxID=2991418 RepID=A0AAF0CVS2_9ENTE|nr:tRNA (adenosine(37)-N6)-dimethylallyltransferase MiaA [Vagococcus intermedius]WEG73930.1 tRNA (adenosine(37)-N6)-dimethylallyltransferase MiaA [Vagococcus intermedius]WEG76011.1 tRNA (adenosine(37)-N6)-dimethylallyltransferase MiaA [Vagococcus intermedius]
MRSKRVKKEKVLVIVGPTAVGKTALSIELAKKYQGEIISGDSLQVYRGLDIGTAKATLEERQGIPHHLLDVCDLGDTYSVSDFQVAGRQKIQEITTRGKLPIVVGGTGLYIQALLFDFELGGKEETASNETLRKELAEYGDRYGHLQLWERLNEQDSAAAAVIHPNNVKRVMRAIEVFELTGQSIMQQKQVDFKDLTQALYDVKLIALTTERDRLYQRINQRVDLMVECGVLEEAKKVYEFGKCQAEQGIGYKEFYPYFEGEQPLEAASELVKQQSRRYAKRQLTWFRNRMTASWWDLVQDPSSQKSLEEEVEEWL